MQKAVEHPHLLDRDRLLQVRPTASNPKDNPFCSCRLLQVLQVLLVMRIARLPTAAVPMDNPYCSCKLTRGGAGGPAAAVLAYSCKPCG